MRRTSRDARVIWILATVALLLPGCSDDDGACPLAPEERAQFVLDLTPVIIVPGEPDGFAVNAVFTTDDLSIVPDVVVNGTLMRDFDVESGLLRGTVVAPFDPLSPVIRFDITAGPRTASDSLTVSFERPDGITCNGRGVVSEFTIQVPDSSDYTFRWDCDDCDGFLVEIRKDFGDSPSRQLLALQTASDSLTVAAAVFAGWNPVTFRIGTITGVPLVPGATPNVTGSYGSGFVACGPPIGYMQEAYVEIQAPQSGSSATGPDLRPLLTSRRDARRRL